MKRVCRGFLSVLKIKKKLARKIITAVLVASLTGAMSMIAYAGQWKQDTTGWWYQRENGSYPANEWNWIDGKCYYFTPAGYCLLNGTTPDGWQVDSTGAWIVNGVVQTQGDTHSGQFQLSEDERFQLIEFANTVYDGMDYAMNIESENWARSAFPVNVRAEKLPSYAKASILFWYQYFHESSDERIKEVNVKEGKYFQPYHSIAENDLKDMMTELLGSCTDEDMNSLQRHHVSGRNTDGTFLMECIGSFGDAGFFWLSGENVSCAKENGRLKLTGMVMQVPEEGTGSPYPEKNFSVWFIQDERSPVSGYRFDQLIVN